MQLSFNCGYPVATTNFKMHGQANRIYAILHLMKQILISIHINRELYALRFELIFFFCSKNLRLFFNQPRFIQICLVLALRSLFTLGNQCSTCVHWYSIVQAQSVRYINTVYKSSPLMFKRAIESPNLFLIILTYENQLLQYKIGSQRILNSYNVHKVH